MPLFQRLDDAGCPNLAQTLCSARVVDTRFSRITARSRSAMNSRPGFPPGERRTTASERIAPISTIALNAEGGWERSPPRRRRSQEPFVGRYKRPRQRHSTVRRITVFTAPQGNRSTRPANTIRNTRPLVTEAGTTAMAPLGIRRQLERRQDDHGRRLIRWVRLEARADRRRLAGEVKELLSRDPSALTIASSLFRAGGKLRRSPQSTNDCPLPISVRRYHAVAPASDLLPLNK